ncbi:hypothetical protein V1478_013641 [Vespula squamosa]|uniref:Uncharacterized protein n=1 Tax=Vespula squamosa TaxID=30214 RepID=A0ABD2A5S3_VESSQ
MLHMSAEYLSNQSNFQHSVFILYLSNSSIFICTVIPSYKLRDSTLLCHDTAELNKDCGSYHAP